MILYYESLLFGPALAEAYILESKAAMYPRVILHKEIIDLAGKYRVDHHTIKDEKGYVESLLEKDSDGMYYIDYFLKASEELDEPLYGFPDYLDKIGNKIRKGLMGSSSVYKSDVKVKYRWMKERYNSVIDKIQDKRYIKSLQDNNEFEMVEIFKKFKKINPSA